MTSSTTQLLYVYSVKYMYYNISGPSIFYINNINKLVSVSIKDLLDHGRYKTIETNSKYINLTTCIILHYILSNMNFNSMFYSILELNTKCM